jgi:DMSO/TMAO reductase YedYZ molybdopterin-dependent catalytic subunit
MLKPDLTVRTTDPLNVESRVDLLMGHETPVEHFFLRSHGAIPEVDVSTWRLTVDGLVATPLSLDYEAVTALAAETRRLVLECSGNGRSSFDPPAKGLAWGPAAVSQARWTGTRLDALLDRAGLAPDASHVVFHPLGAPGAGKPPYLRSLPIADLRRRGALVAWEMAGERLTAPHGFPLRVVVPGWNGQHWVKWLTRIEVTREPMRGFYMDEEYRDVDGSVIGGSHVKSLITWPADGARLRHRMLGLSGIAWAGEREVTRVEASIDGGATWREATLSSHGGHGAWRRWDLNVELDAAASGEIVVAARATDDLGRTQPEVATWNPLGYLWNGYHRIRIKVE